ncbi:fibropellin-1-like isoform X1 [Lytechinus pictus]|uniref:fibropellin-1-like isoform X1 n=1 Tax=Lytechinus pictus TaxID=7653 RepID=UPI0030BA2ADD
MHLRSTISVLISLGMIAPSLQCLHLFRPQATPCSSEPCQQGAECFDDEMDHYACVCPPGYTGTNCEIETACSSSPCLFGACTPQGDEGYLCDCEPGFTGENCNIVAETPCFSSPCEKGKDCIDMDNGYRCECPEGYSGDNCETKDPCSPNPCQNNGECGIDGESYECYCEGAFTGDNCDIPIECENNMYFRDCASPCGPARCGVTIDSCITSCDRKCTCPPNTQLCPEGMLPGMTCVTNCTECYMP